MKSKKSASRSRTWDPSSQRHVQAELHDRVRGWIQSRVDHSTWKQELARPGRRMGGETTDAAVSHRAMEEIISNAQVSAAEKTVAREQVAAEFKKLEATKNEIKSEIAKHQPDAQAASGAWNALQKLTDASLVIFRSTFAQQLQIIQDLTQDQKTEQAAQDEIMKQAQAEKSSWLGWAWRKTKEGVTKIWSTVIWAFKQAFFLIGKVLSTIIGSVKSLATWLSGKIMESPSQTRLMLTLLNLLKKGICRQVAVWLTASSQAREEHKLNVNFFDPKEMVSALGGATLERGITIAIQQGAVEKVGDVIKKAACKTLESIPIIGGALSVFSDVLVDSMTQSAKEATEFYMYYTSVTKSFQDLIDLFDPRSCIYQFQRSRNEVQCVLQGNEKHLCVRLTELQDAQENARDALQIQHKLVQSLTEAKQKAIELERLRTAYRDLDERTLRVKEHETYMRCLRSPGVGCDTRPKLTPLADAQAIEFALSSDPTKPRSGTVLYSGLELFEVSSPGGRRDILFYTDLVPNSLKIITRTSDPIAGERLGGDRTLHSLVLEPLPGGYDIVG